MRSRTHRKRPAQLALPARSSRRRVRPDPEPLPGLLEKRPRCLSASVCRDRVGIVVTLRMPAEWEPHRATWISWPHHEPDWPGKLAPIPWVYAEIARVLADHEAVEILCHSDDVRK